MFDHCKERLFLMSDNVTMPQADTPKSFAELRPIALRLALQLPDNRPDAEVVVGLLADLIEWVHPRDFSSDRRIRERRGDD
jgi:hypothetical protein